MRTLTPYELIQAIRKALEYGVFTDDELQALEDMLHQAPRRDHALRPEDDDPDRSL